MIVYNMKERGPFEYDKLILNSLSFHNLIHFSLKNEVESGESVKSLTALHKSVNEMFDKINKSSYSDKINKKYFNMED